MSSSKYISTNSREYAQYVLESRAIPMMTDGLKLSQRIALYLLKDQKTPIKTAGHVGKMMASHLYDHGDASAADAISRMAAPFLNNHPLVQGEGAFGTRVAPLKGIGAPRYTEVRRAKFADRLYIDFELCPLRENYDGSTMMPQTFLPLIPLVLLNGVKGIAVGFATNILPRKLEDVIQATTDVLERGYTELDLLPFYDRYNGPVIRDTKNPNKYYLHGIVEINNTSTVTITDLPPSMELETIIGRLIALEDNNEIVSFQDNSTDVIDITVKMTRSKLANHDELSLVSLFKIIVAETENLTVINSDGKKVHKYENPNDLIKDFVAWRLPFMKKRYQRLWELANDDAMFYKCIIKCFEKVDGESVVDILQFIESKKELMEIIQDVADINSINVTTDMISKIASLPVYKFTTDEKSKMEKMLESLEQQMEAHTKIIESKHRQITVYKKEIVI